MGPMRDAMSSCRFDGVGTVAAAACMRLSVSTGGVAPPSCRHDGVWPEAASVQLPRPCAAAAAADGGVLVGGDCPAFMRATTNGDPR